MSTTVYQIVTDRIIAKLEEGVIPWKKPWNAEAGAPKNLVSKRDYRGINSFLLGMSAYESPYWMTYRQAQTFGANVRKGEKSTPVVFWKQLETTDKKSGDAISIPLLRYYNVFNLSQVEGMPEKHLPPAPAATDREFNPITSAAALVDAMPQRPQIVHGSTAAYYRPSTDTVSMPRPESFVGSAEYYSTLFHELAHSTGAAVRLNRPEITAGDVSFGSHSYGKEELLAEMTAAFICATAGIDMTIDNSAAYVQSWMRTIKADSKLLILAASGAQKAADFILNRSPVVVEAE